MNNPVVKATQKLPVFSNVYKTILMEKLLTKKEVGEYLNVSIATFYRTSPNFLNLQEI